MRQEAKAQAQKDGLLRIIGDTNPMMSQMVSQDLISPSAASSAVYNAQAAANKPVKQDIIKGADGHNYYSTGPKAGERVLPNVVAAPSGVNVTVNNDSMPGLSKLGEGITYLYNADGSVKRDDRGAPISAPIIGTKASNTQIELEKKSELRADGAKRVSDVVTKAAGYARDAANERAFGSFGQSIVSLNPYSDSAEVERQVKVLKSNAQVENLNSMRASSPTGGALGSVTENELKMLSDKTGALDPSSPNFLRDLDDYELSLLKVIHGNEAGTMIFEQTRMGDDVDKNQPPEIESLVDQYAD